MPGGDGSAPGGGSSIVRQWLSSLGLAQYCQAFYDNGYDELEICKAIGPADLEAIGVNCAEHQDALLASVRTMREEGATSIYFTLEPSAAATAAAAFKPPTEWTCPPPDQQPPPPPLPPLRAAMSNDGDKYAEGKTALAHGGGDLSGIAAAISTAAWSLTDSTASCELNASAIGKDFVDDDQVRLSARSSQFSSQSTPSTSPAHSCHHQLQQLSKLSGRCSTSEMTQMGSTAATPPVRTIEHTCGRGGSVRVPPAAGTAALAQQWQQHRRQQRCTCCTGNNNNFDGSAMRHAPLRGHLHSSSAPVTPAHVAAAVAAPSSRAGGLQQQQHRTPAAAASAAAALTHEERMRVLCDMTQGQLSVGEAVALLSQKRSPKPANEDLAIAGDPARRQKKTSEKRTSNFLKLLSFRKVKKTQSQDQDRSEKKGHKLQQQQQQPHHDAIASFGDAAAKSGRPAGKQAASGSAVDGRANGMPVASLHGAGAAGAAGCAHMAQAACSGCLGSSSAVKWAMSRSHMSSRGRQLSYDGGAGGGSSSTSSGSLTSVAGLGGSAGGGGCSGNGCCSCSHDDRLGNINSSSSRGGVGSSAAAAAAATTTTAAVQRSGAPTPRHNLFYSPQVARRHYDPAGRRWTEDGDEDDSVWLPTSGAGIAAAGSAMTMRPEATAGASRRRLPARSPTVDFTGASGSCSVVDHVGFEHVDQRKRDSGCYGSGDCLHPPRTSVGGGSSSGGCGGGHLKHSVSSSSSLSSRDSCSTAAAAAATGATASTTAPIGADLAAASRAGLETGLLADNRCCSSDRLDAQHCHHHRQCNRSGGPSLLHRDAGSVSSLSTAGPSSHSRHRLGSSASMQQQQPQQQRQLQLTQLFRGLDLDVALRLQQYGISLQDSPYTTADGRWSVPPAVVMRLAQEVAIEAQEACAILDRVRVKLLAAAGRPAVALEMSFQEPAAATVTRMRQQPATVCHFLLAAGLPGYEGLFALHGYDTIDQMALMTHADILGCGISDAAHIHTLLSLAGELPRPQSGGGAAGRTANGRCSSHSALVGMS